MKKNILIIVLVLVMGLLAGVFLVSQYRPTWLGLDQGVCCGWDQSQMAVKDFHSCINAGNPAMESYPRQCRDSEGNLYVENIGNELEKQDLIRLDYPRPNAKISSPLIISGEARGPWFFEGDFPVVLTDWDGLIIAEGYATAEGEWMTEKFVPFTAELKFKKPEYKDNGSLILQKDNPSGLVSLDDSLEIPIYFE